MMKPRQGDKTALKRIVTVGMLLTAMSLVLVAQAAASEPTGNYKIFKDCPYENTAVKQCTFSETLGGEVIVGKSKVNITKPMLLQVGSKLNFATGKEEVYAAKDGITLSKAAEPVEGGLLKLIPKTDLPEIFWPAYEAIFENGLSGVNAVTELAKPASEIGLSASNLAAGEGVALTLPAKVHLENPFLGSSCYIGSSTSPITLNLTTGKTSPPGPNTSISGFPGTFEFLEEGEILKDTGYTLVDNAFGATMTASGCEISILGGLFKISLNSIVNSTVGLPSAAGNNTAILKGNLSRGFAPAVRESVK
jgi:hypothetical protein